MFFQGFFFLKGSLLFCSGFSFVFLFCKVFFLQGFLFISASVVFFARSSSFFAFFFLQDFFFAQVYFFFLLQGFFFVCFLSRGFVFVFASGVVCFFFSQCFFCVCVFFEGVNGLCYIAWVSLFQRAHLLFCLHSMCTVLMNTSCIAVCDILDIISSLSSFLVSHAPRLHLQFTHTSRCAVPRSTPMSSEGVFSSNFFLRQELFFFACFCAGLCVFFFARGCVCLLAIGFCVFFFTLVFVLLFSQGFFFWQGGCFFVFKVFFFFHCFFFIF